MKTVLIFSTATDIHARVVAKEIERAHGQAVILDVADFPKKWKLSFSLSNSSNSVSIHHGNQSISGDDLVGVWWRRAHRHRIPQVTDPKIRTFCYNESQALFQGWIYSLDWKIINPLSAQFAADRKPLQLHRATSIGLQIPDTVITNSPEEAEDFVRRRKSGAVFKILTSTSWQLTETRDFKPGYFKQLSKLKMAPAIFQEKIQSKEDIRVTIIDDAVFAVSIRATHRLAKLDWRLDPAPKITPHDLPKDIKKKLVKLLEALGLRFGAIDLGLTPQNDYVFYEVNPAGQFLFCEIHGKQKISRALAAALLRSA
jgi:hypothetical protein